MISQMRRLFKKSTIPEPEPPAEEPHPYDFIPAIAEALLREGQEMWAEKPHEIAQAIAKVEKSWALQPGPETAIQLGVMYDRVNRHRDAISIYRQAFHTHPEHPRLRHEAGITLLRHGSAEEAKEFFDSVMRIDPNDAFAAYYDGFATCYRAWIDELHQAILAKSSAREQFIIACPVWGTQFAEDFVRYLCASLLSPNNLTALASKRPVHFVVFTTPETRDWLMDQPIIGQVARHASIHFALYSDTMVPFAQTMRDHYGDALGPYYARTCKFLLMSSAHYAALSVARQIDGFAIPLGADAIFSDGSLPAMARYMDEGKDIVLLVGIRLGDDVQPLIESFRSSAGVLSLSSRDVSELYVRHIPESYFAESASFALTPIMMCWRVGTTGILVHSNHYHPVCIRAGATQHPFPLTIDPVDSRFVDRAGFSLEKAHLVQDDEIAGFGVEAEPIIGQSSATPHKMIPRDVGLWLWGVWGEVRSAYFRAPLRYSTVPITSEWTAVESKARRIVDEALATSTAYERNNRQYRTWKLQDDIDC